MPTIALPNATTTAARIMDAITAALAGEARVPWTRRARLDSPVHGECWELYHPGLSKRVVMTVHRATGGAWTFGCDHGSSVRVFVPVSPADVVEGVSVICYRTNDTIGGRATRELLCASSYELSGTGAVPARLVDDVWTLADASDDDARTVYAVP